MLMNSYSNCIDFLLSRRSIRKFQDREVSMEIIEKILDIARYAPSAKNRQPWIFIIVRDREIIDKLSNIHVSALPLRNAPSAIVVACNKLESPVSYQVDCANAAMYIMLAAHALGLGTVWIQTLRNIEQIQEILKLPQHIIPIAILAIGWPAEKPIAKPRKPLTDLICINTYCKHSA